MTSQPQAAGGPTALAPDLQAAVTLLVNAIVARNGVPAPIHEAEATIDDMRTAIGSLWSKAADPQLFALIAGEALQQIAVDIDPPVLLAPDFEPWFNEAVVGGKVKLERWYSYKQFLTHAKGFAPQVLDSLDQASSEVVDLLGDPTQTGSWKRRGLVIGDVQSGKTATYIGIVNKAADAGFKLVVLLTEERSLFASRPSIESTKASLGRTQRSSTTRSSGLGSFRRKRSSYGAKE